MSLQDFAPLAATGIPFVGLQKGPAAQQRAPNGLKVLRLDDEIQRFEDTAAILEHLDILISVDSSPIHLAGALGRPALVLLPFEAEWRWMARRKDTPWYPTHRLYRQERRGDWTVPIARIVEDLQSCQW